MLSVIIPAYNEEEMVERAAAVIAEVLTSAAIHHELLFVDDGSKDETWAKIRQAADTVDGVRGIHFSRNFGKEAAIMAGLKKAEGDCCVVIDCDLQHPPEKIVEMYRLWEEGYEVVEAVKSSRGTESRLHSWAAKLFYRMISAAVGLDMSKASDFKLMDRCVVCSLLEMPERNAFFRALSSWVGFKSATVTFDVRDREAGESKWSTKALVKYAVNNIASFTAAPMQIITVLGIVMLMLSAVLGGNALIQKLMGRALEGFTTVILIQLFASSIIMISLGIIGYYISRIYEEVKGRPRYIISETCSGKTEREITH